MSAEDCDDKDPLQSLIAEILETENRGETVDREDLIDQHPDQADSLKEFFASHDRMKSAADIDPPTLPPASGSTLEDPTILPGSMDEDPTIPPTGPASGEPASGDNGPEIGDKVRYFGDYELLEEIARGGMGVVYKARQANLNRVVALKMILAGQFAGEEDVQRFYTEAEAAASLDHPGIVPIFEIGEHAGQHYFSMGYIEGESLAQRVDDGPLPPQEAAELVKKICDAMAYAHERGVIHRDLKPANILIDSNGQPKVTDFGLAKKTEADSGLTGTGQILGTPAYMPPEQASGKTDVGPLADVYSLGAILYCLITGRPPFQAASPMDTLLQVLDQEPVAPRIQNPQVPSDLDTICLKCLNKSPAKRYESAEALQVELQRFLDGEPIHARPVGALERGWRWCKRKPIVAGLIAAVILLVIIGSSASATLGVMAVNRADEAEENLQLARDEAKRADEKTDEAVASAEKERLARKETEKERNNANIERDRATSAKETAEATLARSNYLLAVTRWDANRAPEANDLLDKVPPKYRQFEWRLAKRQFRGSDVTFYGHTSSVNSVCFSPNGERIATGSRDGTVKLWDAATGEQLRTLKGHKAWVTSVCVSPDGGWIASGSGDRTVRLWDAVTGEEIRALTGHKGVVTSVCFSPDGGRIVSGSKDKTVKLWDAATGEEIRTLKGHTDDIDSVCFSPDGGRIATGCDDKTVKLWDVTTGEEIRTFKARSGAYSVCFSPDGMQIAVGGRGTVKLSDVATGRFLRTLEGHEDRVLSVCFSPDGGRIASGSWDRTIKLWNVTTGEEIRTLKGHKNFVSSVCFSPDGGRIATGGYETVKLWDAATGEELRTLKGHKSFVTSVCFSPDGGRIASVGGMSRTFKLWDAATGEEIRTLKVHADSVDSVCFSPDGTRIATASRDKTIKLWDAATGDELRTLKGHKGTVLSVCFSPDGGRIATGSGDDTIKLWDAAADDELRTLTGHTREVLSYCFSPDGGRIATGSSDKTIKLWDAATGDELRTLKGHTSLVSSVCFSPDGAWIASGSWDKTIKPFGEIDNTIKLWDAATGEELRTINGHKYRITSVCFSPDGGRLYSQSPYKRLVWNTNTGLQILNALWEPPESRPNNSPDGRWLAVPSGNQVLLVDTEFKNTPAEKAYRAFKAKPNLFWHDQQATEATRMGQWLSATFHTAWVLKLNPDSQSASERLQNAYSKLDPDVAKLLPTVVTESLALPAIDAITRLRRAHSLAKDGKFDEAIEQYRIVLKVSPSSTAHYFLGKALQGEGRSDEARVEYRSALQMLDEEVGDDLLKQITFAGLPRFSKTYVYYSLVAVEREAGNHDAEQSVWKEFNALLEANPEPNATVYWGNLGQSCYEIDRLPDARRAFEKALAMLHETEPTINGGPRWWYMTMILARLGETEKAKGYYGKLSAELGEDASESQLRFQTEAAKLLGEAAENLKLGE